MLAVQAASFRSALAQHIKAPVCLSDPCNPYLWGPGKPYATSLSFQAAQAAPAAASVPRPRANPEKSRSLTAGLLENVKSVKGKGIKLCVIIFPVLDMYMQCSGTCFPAWLGALI